MTEEQDIKILLCEIRACEGWTILTPYRKNLLDEYITHLEQTNAGLLNTLKHQP